MISKHFTFRHAHIYVQQIPEYLEIWIKIGQKANHALKYKGEYLTFLCFVKFP